MSTNRKSTHSESRGRKRRTTDSTPTPLRRSLRLSNKYTPISASLYSRSTLRSQCIDEESDIVNVLDESGQSVPFDFDNSGDGAGAYHDHTYSRGNQSVRYPFSSYDTDARESTPPLYGTDNNPDELDTLRHHYDVYNKERILTPPKWIPLPCTAEVSLCAQFVNSLMRFVCGIGALVYLLFAGIVSLDIQVFHRGASACSRYTKSFFQSLAFVIVLFGIIFISCTAPYLDYSKPLPPPAPSVETMTATVTQTVVPTPQPLPIDYQKIRDNLDGLQNEFNKYKLNQKNELSQILSRLDDNINKAAEKFKSLENFDVELNKKLREDKAKTDLAIDKVKTESLEELRNSTRDFVDNRINLLISDSMNNSNGSMDMSSVQLLIHQTLNKSLNETRLPLEEMISNLQLSIAQLKSERQNDLKDLHTALNNLRSELDSKWLQMLSKDNQTFDELTDVLNQSVDKLEQMITHLEKRVKILENKEPPAPPTPVDTIDEETVLRLISEALYKYSADQIARFDYALESAGGSVLESSATFDSSKTKAKLFGFSLPISLSRSNPGVILQPNVLPGDCWCFERDRGYVIIKLATAITVEGITLQHLPRELSPLGKLDSAIKDFTVKGLTSVNDDATSKVLGNFKYLIDLGAQPIQTFDINNEHKFDTVRLDITSNHGNPQFTCVYRVRVHGH